MDFTHVLCIFEELLSGFTFPIRRVRATTSSATTGRTLVARAPFNESLVMPPAGNKGPMV